MFPHVSQIQFPWGGKPGRRDFVFLLSFFLTVTWFHVTLRGLALGPNTGGVPGAGVTLVRLALEPEKYAAHAARCVLIIAFVSKFLPQRLISHFHESF